IESTKTKTVQIDKTLPVVSCATADGVWHATDVGVACTAADSLSGLANLADASFSLSTSVPAETETNNACTGTHAVLDRADNSTKEFHGNFVPLKLQLCDANDVNVSSPGIVVHATVVDPGAIPATSMANPTNDFLFNSGQGGYVYVLNTKTLPAGSYALEFTVTGDPITHSAPFMLN